MAKKTAYSESEKSSYNIGKTMGKSELTLFKAMTSAQKKSFINGKQASKKPNAPRKAKTLFGK